MKVVFALVGGCGAAAFRHQRRFMRRGGGAGGINRGGSLFQDFYDEQGVFAENFWPQSEPAQALAFNPRGRVSKALTPPPTTQSINNQVSDRAEAELDGRNSEFQLHL